ncbi:aldehyde dehydrogenase [Linderina pennispora]|uniref:Aldehyde dehydrogenase n=1 Tax=Linderina pennispora TaxID=61395 RepID=A0A1Y1VT59_9FUNG|nr:aldehyde dehydrogenase [Linderina pennispora]ORX64482.1 aldehyde dehydrogenase [Linderina pennispora]
MRSSAPVACHGRTGLIYIDGRWVQSTSTATHNVENPDTGDVIAVVPECNAQDLDKAVQAAYNAFHDGPWANQFSGAERRDALIAVADAIEEHRAELELIESINTGKPISDMHVEVDDTIDLFRHFAGYADKVEGRHIGHQTNQTIEGYTVKVPVGVVGFINAFNYPLNLLGWKVAPALAAGCTVYFAYLLEKTGKFPPGVFNVGQALVDHDLVDKIGFTGSVATGKHVIRSTASTQNVRSTSVELGGKSPGVVMPDADLDKTAQLVVSGCMSNAGMNCNALTRLWVHRDIYDEFMPKIKAAAESMVLGAPQRRHGDGPVIDKRQFDRVMEYIRIGKEEDKAAVLTGGERAFDRGDARIATEEIFGPVLSVLEPFDSLDEVIEIERKNEFGLAAGIFSRNHQDIKKFTRKLRSGTIWVNTYNALFSYLPFGGFRNSGFGRELGYESFDGYLVPKSIIDDVSY